MTPLSKFSDTETEWHVIGAVIVSGDAAKIAFEMLTKNDFYAPRIASLFEKLRDMRDECEAIDETLVDSQLSAAGLLARNPNDFNSDTHLCTRDDIGNAVAKCNAASIEGYCNILKVLFQKRKRLEEAEREYQAAENGESPFPQKTKINGAPILRSMADIKAEVLHWLWPGRIPLGKITIIAGDPGLGKSFLTLDIAARVSTGRPFPDSMQSIAGSVILLNAEDDAADTIRPRLDALQADVSKIIILDGVESKGGKKYFNLAEHLSAIEAALNIHPDVKLIIIDPISAYLGNTDSHTNAEVRGLLAPLADLASKYRVAVIMVTHFNKGNGGASKAIHRAMGSVAFVGAARAGWTVQKDNDDDKRRLFLAMKNNLAPETTGLAYRIVDGVVAWEADPVSITADECMADEFPQREKKSDTAADWLKKMLAGGPIKSTELKEQAKSAALSWRTIENAKDAASVIVERAPGFGSNGFWQWRLR